MNFTGKLEGLKMDYATKKQSIYVIIILDMMKRQKTYDSHLIMSPTT